MSFEIGAAQRAKIMFPAGLKQPPGSFRFGSDALLLAAFAKAALENGEAGPRRLKVAELGCGCGAALLALAQGLPQVIGWGVDLDWELTDAARGNARLLGVGGRTSWFTWNLRHYWPPGCERQAFDLVMANPPWLEERRGKACPSRLKELAIAGGKGILSAFLDYAAGLAAPSGAICMVAHMELADRIQDEILKHGLYPARLIWLVPFAQDRASRFLIMARSYQGPIVSENLILHYRKKVGTGWTREALDFCPWLARSYGAVADNWLQPDIGL